MRKIVNLIPPDYESTGGYSIWEMPPAPTYLKDRVVMIGDAAHASTPFMGSGAAIAVEDSCVLHTFLGKYLDPERVSKSSLSMARALT